MIKLLKKIIFMIKNKLNINKNNLIINNPDDKEKKYKTGVSNWIFKFENEKNKEQENEIVVVINRVSNERIEYNSSEKIRILINNVSLEKKLLQLFKEGKKIKEVKQIFYLMDESHNYIKEEWTYKNIKIEKINIISKLDEFCTFNIVLKN